jgi:aspartyl-tRNA synthetase
MYRSHSGELNASHINTEVTLAGWVQNQRQGIHELDWFAWPLWNNTIDFDEGRTENGFDLAKNIGSRIRNSG